MTAARTALVIGGGIAGPVTALALRKAGIEPIVYEAYPTQADGIGGLLMIAPNGLDALGIVGVDEDVRAIGHPIPGMAIEDGRTGRRIAEFAGLPDLPPSQVVWRGDLYRLLHDHAHKQGIRIEYGKRLVGVDETPTGITARFADGSTATGDVLIGADGIRSAVRALIDPGAPGPQHVGLISFGGYGPENRTEDTSDVMHFANGRRAFFGYWKHPDGRTAWFSNLPHERPMTMTEARERPMADWLQELRSAYAGDVPAEEVLRHTDADGMFAFGSMEMLPTVPRWHRGRMVLVGDSAHAPSSSSGQGASLAAESAVQLARCLRDLPDAPTAFAAYERLRRARVEKIAAHAARTNNQKAAGPVARLLMGVLMPIVMRTVLKPERLFGPMHRYRIDWDQVVTA